MVSTWFFSLVRTLCLLLETSYICFLNLSYCLMCIHVFTWCELLVYPHKRVLYITLGNDFTVLFINQHLLRIIFFVMHCYRDWGYKSHRERSVPFPQRAERWWHRCHALRKKKKRAKFELVKNKGKPTKHKIRVIV